MSEKPFFCADQPPENVGESISDMLLLLLNLLEHFQCRTHELLNSTILALGLSVEVNFADCFERIRTQIHKTVDKAQYVTLSRISSAL